MRECATDALLCVCHYANFGVALMCNMEPLFFIITLRECMSGIRYLWLYAILVFFFYLALFSYNALC